MVVFPRALGGRVRASGSRASLPLFVHWLAGMLASRVHAIRPLNGYQPSACLASQVRGAGKAGGWVYREMTDGPA